MLVIPMRFRMVVTAFLIVAVAGCADRAGTAARPVAPRLTVDIIMKTTTVVRGRDLSGILRVTNNTGRPVTLANSGGCRIPWTVALEGARVKAVPAFTSTCDRRPRVAATGITDWPFTTTSRYPACTNDRSAVTSQFPACTPDGTLPPLPAGDYRAVLVSQAPLLPVPPPVTVRLLTQ